MWSAPNAFRKCGLQRTIVETEHAQFIYQVKPDGACDPARYGYRGEFLELKEFDGQDKQDEKVPEKKTAKDKNETHMREQLCKCSN